MFLIKISIATLVLFCLYESYNCQVSFSTNWGSGKRSGNIFTAPTDQTSICLSRMEYNILKELSGLVRREIRQATKCLQENKEYEYEYSNNQRQPSWSPFKYTHRYKEKNSSNNKDGQN